MSASHPSGEGLPARAPCPHGPQFVAASQLSTHSTQTEQLTASMYASVAPGQAAKHWSWHVVVKQGLRQLISPGVSGWLSNVSHSVAQLPVCVHVMQSLQRADWIEPGMPVSQAAGGLPKQFVLASQLFGHSSQMTHVTSAS